MKTLGVIAGLVLAQSVQADVYDWARVIEAEPIREWVRVPTEREVCWNEPRRRGHHRDGNATDVVVGSVIGGVIGNQFGKGKGKDAATVAGALLGAAIASDAQAQKHARDHAHGDEMIRRCRIETDYVERQEITGYEVTYRYKGETYRTFMNHDPGNRIKVRVTVTPAQ